MAAFITETEDGWLWEANAVHGEGFKRININGKELFVGLISSFGTGVCRNREDAISQIKAIVPGFIDRDVSRETL